MTPEREMEIRASVALTRYDRREPGDSPGEQIRDTLAALDAEREKVARLERERDELAAQLACDACDGSGVAVSGPCGCGGRGLPEMLRAVRVALHDVTRERDELAAQLAALVDALRGLAVSSAALSSAAACARRVFEARGEATRHPWMLGPSEHNPSGTVLTDAGAAKCDEARWLRARARELRGGR